MMESRHDHQMNHCQPKNDKLGIDKGIKCASQHKSAGEKKNTILTVKLVPLTKPCWKVIQ